MTYIHRKPRSDAEFLEAMAQILFVSGFNWNVVQKRWPKIRKAFNNFDISKVARERVEKIMRREGMIRNRSKIAAVIENARSIQDIAKRHGSVMRWVKEVQQKHKKQPLFNPSVREEMQKFRNIGKTTSRWMAYVVTRDESLRHEHQ
ncbi:DNA-3-methyladenine glycosylase I [Candidatus Woesearchaeota archaeon]|nr:DNA-3-methyladenine glycosylase I [Candidatus Woesearchaeota archaeon]